MIKDSKGNQVEKALQGLKEGKVHQVVLGDQEQREKW